MDLSDEIAYAAHDLEDALSRSMVSIEDIVYEFGRSDYKDSIGLLNEIIENSKSHSFESIQTKFIRRVRHYIQKRIDIQYC